MICIILQVWYCSAFVQRCIVNILHLIYVPNWNLSFWWFNCSCFGVAGNNKTAYFQGLSERKERKGSVFGWQHTWVLGFGRILLKHLRDTMKRWLVSIRLHEECCAMMGYDHKMNELVWICTQCTIWLR